MNSFSAIEWQQVTIPSDDGDTHFELNQRAELDFF